MPKPKAEELQVEEPKEGVAAPELRSDYKRADTPLLITIAVLLALILLGGAFMVGRHSWQPKRQFIYQKQSSIPGLPELGGRRAGIGSYLNSSSRVVGVITKINGNHLTVASNGTTKDVLINSSTRYQGGSSTKVNDSVVVFGSTNNSQFTADQIIVNP